MTTEAVVYLVIAILSWGLGAIFDKLTLRYLDALPAFYGRTMIMIVFFLLFILTRFSKTVNDLVRAPRISLLYISLSVIVSMLGVYTYLKAMSFSDASKIVPLSSTYPLVTFIVAVLFLGESFSFNRFLGTVFVISGVYLISK
ncbi:MAG: EamA family transporter [Elusimicrobia bacterium]|jgi:transporter family protein|nr:EamA family transporter [Elusimicrobiota bacterium]